MQSQDHSCMSRIMLSYRWKPEGKVNKRTSNTNEDGCKYWVWSWYQQRRDLRNFKFLESRRIQMAHYNWALSEKRMKKKKQNIDKMRRFSKRRRIKNRFVGRKFHFNQNGFFGLLKVCTCFSISMVSMTSQLFFLRERHMIDKANHIRDLMLLTSHYLVHKNIFLENLDPTFALFAQI